MLLTGLANCKVRTQTGQIATGVTVHLKVPTLYKRMELLTLLKTTNLSKKKKRASDQHKCPALICSNEATENSAADNGQQVGSWFSNCTPSAQGAAVNAQGRGRVISVFSKETVTANLRQTSCPGSSSFYIRWHRMPFKNITECKAVYLPVVVTQNSKSCFSHYGKQYGGSSNNWEQRYHVTQQSAFWVSPWKIWKHSFANLYAPPCSLQHYSQWPRHGDNHSVLRQMIG